MTKLPEHATVIRSKNTGPYEFALDVIFEERAVYERVKAANLLTRARIARLYGIPESDVRVFVYYDPAKAIKATLRRPVHSGGVGDTDIYGAQQYAPLLDVDVPDE